jgi:hypothetical protein
VLVCVKDKKMPIRESCQHLCYFFTGVRKKIIVVSMLTMLITFLRTGKRSGYTGKLSTSIVDKSARDVHNF